MAFDPETLAAWDAALAALPEPVVRKGKATTYTARNGHMFSFLDGEGELCVRLAPEDHTAFRETHGVGDVVRYNSVMRGYVPVPAALVSDGEALAALIASSWDYVGGLKPK